MYYRRQRRKITTPQRKPIVDAPLNDVWESFQEPKLPKDFGVSDEAILFLSDREKSKQIREKNKTLKNKKSRIDGIKGIFSLSSIVLFIVTMLLFSDGHEKEGIISSALFGFCIAIILLLKIPLAFIERKLIESYDGAESKYNSYIQYLERYNTKKSQYLTHIQELEDFKTNKETAFINGITERLKKVQGRTYRTEDDWRQMTDREFEIEIGKVYSRLGYEATVTKQSGDGGVDVIAKKDGETVYIQCKHYGKKTHLGSPELQGFWGCCSGNGIKRGVMVCTSTLTKDARFFANKLKGQLEIVGMKELLELDKSFYYSHPTNAERSFNVSFKTFILNNHFIDCYHLWLLPEVFYNEEDAKVRLAKLNKWKDYSYVIKDIIVNLTNKIRVFVILLVPDYLMKEVQETRLS